MTGHRAQTALAAACRRARAGPRSPSGWKNSEVFSPRQAPWSCQSQTSATGVGSLRMSAMSPPGLVKPEGAVRLQGAGALGPAWSNTSRSQLFARNFRERPLTPRGEGGCCSPNVSIKVACGRTGSGGERRIRAAPSAEVAAPDREPRPERHRPGIPRTVRARAVAGRGSEEQGVIEERVRGPVNRATGLGDDERRRVRDDVASRLVALPFVGRVEVVGDAASLMSRLATRSPDVLIVGTQRAVDTGLTAATQALRPPPALPFLVLGAPDDAESVRAAVAFGARGYLRWDASPIEMGLGLSRVGLRADGRVPQLAASMQNVGVPAWSGAASLAGSAPTTVRSTVREPTLAVSLSMREMQVLTGMSQGKSNAQIGRELYLSEDTIKTHARRLFASWAPRTVPRRSRRVSAAASCS